MKKIFLLAFVVLLSTTLFGQTDGKNEETIFTSAEVMPEYPGGEQAMMNYVATNVKYPQAAIDKNISGRVMVGFVVEKDGSITDVQVVKGIGGGCNEEAVRVVKAMPKWKPGKEKGKAVRVHYLLPITFKLK